MDGNHTGVSGEQTGAGTGVNSEQRPSTDQRGSAVQGKHGSYSKLNRKSKPGAVRWMRRQYWSILSLWSLILQGRGRSGSEWKAESPGGWGKGK